MTNETKDKIQELIENSINIDTVRLSIRAYSIQVAQNEDYPSSMDYFVSCQFISDSADGEIYITLFNRIRKLHASSISSQYGVLQVSYVGTLTEKDIEALLIK